MKKDCVFFNNEAPKKKDKCRALTNVICDRCECSFYKCKKEYRLTEQLYVEKIR